MSKWNSYISWIQKEVDAAIVAHYEATLKVQKLREKLHEARHQAVKEAHEARHQAVKAATGNVINNEL